ncbi:MAG: hypothetical protein ACTHOH_11390 [Lysobacteraceae bacterium]
MLDFLPFLDGVARATPVFLTFAGLLLFFFREKVKQILARSLSSDLEALRRGIAKELAEHGSQLQRELEAYKVSLIAESERVKAAQEVKKSLALKIAERKFISVAKLMDAHAGLGVDVVSYVCGPVSSNAQVAAQIFIENGKTVLERLKALSVALNEAGPFLDHATKRLVVQSQAAMSTLLSLKSRPDVPGPSSDGAEVQRVYESSLAVEGALGRILVALESLD